MPSANSLPDWTFEGSTFSSPTNEHGFIYLLTFNDGSKYIGKKDFFSKKTLPALKSGEQRLDSTRTYKNKNGSRVYYDIITKESNWKNYVSSSKLIGDRTVASREILALANSKRELTYLETKYLFIHEVLESDSYLNENILGKFYKFT